MAPMIPSSLSRSARTGRALWLRRGAALTTALTVVLSAAAGCSGDSEPAARPAGISSLTTVATSTSATVATSTATPTSVPAGEVTSTSVAAPVRIMPLGDSITQGNDPIDQTKPQSYRGYLAQRLTVAGYDVDFVGSDDTPTAFGADPDNEGHGGYTIGPDGSTFCTGCEATNLSAHVAAWVGAAQPDVILLLVGANDLLPEPTPNEQGMVRPVDPAQAPEKLRALVAELQVLAPQATVLVASQPPMTFYEGSADTAAAFEQLNAAAESISTVIPSAVPVRLNSALQAGWNAELDSLPDRLHPSSTGAAKMADVWFAALTPVLDTRR